jgi:hypothetical protein
MGDPHFIERDHLHLAVAEAANLIGLDEPLSL